MKKRILPLIVLALLCLCALQPLCVRAITPLDPEADTSLTLHYQNNGALFPDLEIGIYRIAEAFPDGTFQLIAPFSSYPVNIHDISRQEQWLLVAQTLHSYITANQVAPDRTGRTDAEGTVRFSQLETGLYFVQEAVAESTDGTYLFNRFLIYVPTPQPEGTYDYDVEANPKCTQFVPRNHYTVTKLWQDGGKTDARAQSVTVEIYKDGTLYETVVLNAANNWTYTWYVSGDDRSTWTVAERPVPEGYRVTIRQNGNVFSIVNTRQADPEVPPTGDTFPLLPWVLAMCFSGIMLLILGIYLRRRR